MGAHDWLLAWAVALETYVVLQSRPSSSSPPSPFHSTFPTTRITSGFAHSSAAPLHSAWHKSKLVEYNWWERAHELDIVGVHSWCWPKLYRFLWVGSGCGFFDCLPAAVIIDCARRQLCQPGAYWDLWGSHLTQGITTMSYRFKPTHICSCPLMVTLEPLQAGKIFS